MRATDHRTGLLLALLGVVVLSPDTLILRLAGTDHWTLLFWRGLFSGLAYLALIGLSDRGWPFAALLAMGRTGIAAAGLFALSSILFVSSLAYTSVANTLVIISAGPLFAALFSVWLFGEAIAARTWLAALAACLGLALVFAGDLRAAALAGNLCALGAAVSLAGTFVLMRHAQRAIALPALALGGLLITALAAPLATPAGIAPGALWLMALLGIVLLPASFVLLMSATRRIPAPEVHLALLLEALLGPIWVWWALGELPARATFAGGALLIATLALHSLLALRARPRARYG